jgi:predicted kinase
MTGEPAAGTGPGGAQRIVATAQDVPLMPLLIVFAGLPGAGKSTIARAVARHLGAAYLRIDSVEQALRAGGTLPAGVVAEGYAVARAVAADQLAVGLSVVADAVNPLRLTRDAWRAVAGRTGAQLIDVEVVCSDPAAHRRRVETRTTDVPGLVLPSWEAVLTREYHAWDRPRLVLDTAARDAGACVRELLERLPPGV